MDDDKSKVNLDLLRNEYDNLSRRVTELERSKDELRALFEDAQRKYMEELEAVRKEEEEINKRLSDFAESIDGLIRP